MDARKYKVNQDISDFDFPPINGLGQSTLFYQTEPPHIHNAKVALTITTKYILGDVFNKTEHQIVSIRSKFEIPCNEIKGRDDVYQFYKEGVLTLNEFMQHMRAQFPALREISFPTPPIENYKQEIDGVFYVLESQN